MPIEQEQLRTICPNMHIPVVEIDLDLKLIYANPAALQLLRRKESFLNSETSVLDLISPNHQNLVETALRALQEGAEPSSISIRALRSDGVEIPIETFGDTVLCKGKVCGFVVYVLDMTRRAHVEDKLKEQKEFFDLVIEHSHAGIFLVNDSFGFDYVNDRFCELVGRTRSELIGHDFREFLHPESLKMVEERYIRRQRGEDVPKTYSFRILRKDGEIRVVEITSVTMQARDGSTKTVAQLIDITDETEGRELLKQSEYMYRTLVETMEDGLAIDDTSGNLVYANDALARMMGYDCGSDLIGFQDGDILNGFTNDVFKKKYSERLEGTPESYETFLKHKSGRHVPVYVSASPFYDISGEFAGTFAIFSNMSELREAEAETRFLLDLLMHDIGNQLQLILAGSDLCNKESSIEVVEGAQQYVRDGAQRCLDLITKIRHAEEAKDQPLSKMDLIPVLKAEVNLLNRLYDIDLKVTNIPESITILADGALSQMLWNLMENAVKHNTNEDRKLWIEGNLKDGEFELSISDNGPGLGPAERTQIFKEVRRFGGVGLHIVRQLVQKYGATMWAEDRVEGYRQEGLRVVISFPIKSDSSE